MYGAIGTVLILLLFQSSITMADETCPENERYVSCAAAFCGYQHCSQLGYPVMCAQIRGPCPGGCVCNIDYLRDDKGVCIPQKECPSCNGDTNATSGCPNRCGNSCSDYKETNLSCSNSTYCVYYECTCKPGFIYDESTDRCVTPDSCK